MKDHDGDKREFVIDSETWYHKANPFPSDVTEEIDFGLYSGDSGTSGEMHVRWYNLSTHNAAKLEVFYDGWSVLWQFRDVLEAMVEMDNSYGPTPQEFVELLKAHGFTDTTARKDPYAQEATQ